MKLIPSEPNYDVNLINQTYTIDKKESVDVLSYYLENVELCFPSHPVRIWETKLVLCTDNNDSAIFRIHKTEDDGTIIYGKSNKWRNDDLGNYLELLIGEKKD